jgi:hypothetical protein
MTISAVITMTVRITQARRGWLAGTSGPTFIFVNNFLTVAFPFVMMLAIVGVAAPRLTDYERDVT